MKIIRVIPIAIFLLLQVNCASLTSVMPKTKVFDIPSLNEEQQSEIGETLVSKGKISSHQGLILHSEAVSKTGLPIGKKVCPAQTLIFRNYNKSFDYYYGTIPVEFHGLFDLHWPGGICISKKEKDRGQLYIFNSIDYSRYKPDTKLSYELLPIDALELPFFKQELIYNGKVDNYVKFMYREISGGTMRQNFNQEVQYDLNESRIVGFKGVRIEIKEATNTTIKYKVLNSFPDSLE